METEFAKQSSLNDGIWSGFYEYSLVAHPDDNTSKKINEEKQNFYNQYHEKVSIKAKPHITISSFLAKEEMEETIIRYMQRICKQQQSFDVMLNNYSGFPPHTIYVRVQNQQPFRQLAMELKAVASYIDACACPPAKFTTNPHVAIAATLNEPVYLKALIDYGQKTFHEIFPVNELVLLRRMNEFDAGKVVNVFHLQPPGRTLFN